MQWLLQITSQLCAGPASGSHMQPGDTLGAEHGTHKGVLDFMVKAMQITVKYA